jgi:hypothetical protein
VKFISIDSAEATADAYYFDVCDPEFSAHAATAITVVTSHRAAAASHVNYVMAGVHLMRANVDVAPWLAVLLAGCSEGNGGRLWRVWVGPVAAAVAILVDLAQPSTVFCLSSCSCSFSTTTTCFPSSCSFSLTLFSSTLSCRTPLHPFPPCSPASMSRLSYRCCCRSSPCCFFLHRKPVCVFDSICQSNAHSPSPPLLFFSLFFSYSPPLCLLHRRPSGVALPTSYPSHLPALFPPFSHFI